jgi:hypothetical protein
MLRRTLKFLEDEKVKKGGIEALGGMDMGALKGQGKSLEAYREKQSGS